MSLSHSRRYAVGDTLRSVYDMLARDPGSLSNLDQDLPNYAQHSVPIFRCLTAPSIAATAPLPRLTAASLPHCIIL